MTAEPTKSCATGSKPRLRWPWYLPTLAILSWWVYDLQFQWRAIVEYQFGWLVLMLTGYLTWELWPARPLGEQFTRLWPSVVLVIIGAPFVLVAELYKQAITNTPASSFALSIGCCCFVAANLLYLGGGALVKHFLFPLLFFFMAVPMPKIIWNPIVLGLQHVITTLDVEVLNLLGIPAVQTGNVIQLPNCAVGVDEACSGIRSLQSSIMAGLFLGFVTLQRFGSRVVFVALGILIALFGNFLRSLYLSLSAHWGGAEGINQIHDTAGWSIMIFTLITLAAVAWVQTKLEKKSADLRGA